MSSRPQILTAAWEALSPEEQSLRRQWDAEQRQQAQQARYQDDRPNILFIFTDQQTATALSCAGNPAINTPHMDGLASRGVRFTRCCCPAPLCGPSRSALITGCPPHETGVIFNGDSPHEMPVNVGTVLRAAGYATHWVGKWHLPESYPGDSEIPGFTAVPLPSGLRWPALPRGDATDLHFAGEAYRLLRWDLPQSPTPWMLSVSLHNPHDICYHCMDERPLPHLNAAHYPDLPPNFEPSPDEPEALIRCRQQGCAGQELPYTLDWSTTRWRAYLDSYARMVQSVDAAVGLILEGLETSGMTEQTLVVFTSDHGEGLASHRWVAKNAFWENVINVPLIMSWPGRLGTAMTMDTLVSGLDLAPTFCDYAQTGLPSARGHSLRPLLQQQTPIERPAVYAELAHAPEQSPTHGRMVRTDRYKYCHYSQGERNEQLFDLDNDPGETRNLVNAVDRHAILHQHRSLLKHWCRETDDPYLVYLS